MLRNFDYIVVGAGSAGCVMANRLSARAANRVLLLEAGQDTPPGQEPADILDTYPSSYYNKSYMWPALQVHWRERHNSPATGFDQGRIIGGGSSVMGMVALRGTPADYDEWERLGASGWGWDGVLLTDYYFFSDYKLAQYKDPLGSFLSLPTEAISQLYLTGVGNRSYFDARTIDVGIFIELDANHALLFGLDAFAGGEFGEPLLDLRGLKHEADAAVLAPFCFGVEVRGHAEDFAVEAEDFYLQIAEDVTASLIVGYDGLARRVVADELGVAARPAAAARDRLHGGLRLYEEGVFGERLGVERAQRHDVVDDPDAAAVRGDDEVVVARVNR